jgi:RNA polymerase sigma-70 factor (ECF subfamily)
MGDDGTSELLARWRAGDQRAAAELFRRYADRLIGLARSRLPAQLTQRLDPEDVVQSVYRSFFSGARSGEYDLQRGGDLWRLLVTITLRKLYNQIGRNSAGKRSVDREQTRDTTEVPADLAAHALAREPSPLEAILLSDELEQLLRRLPPVQQQMVELRLQGYDLNEIAAATHRSQRTVRRVLDGIKLQLEPPAEQ